MLMTKSKQTAAQKKRMALVDKLMMVAATAHPLTALPQVIQIYSTQDVAGVSLQTWLGFMMIGSLYLYYGILHKLKPIILNQILWFIVDILVVAGVLIFG